MLQAMGKKRGLSWESQKGKEMFKEKLQMLDLGLEIRMTHQSETIIRQSETGIDFAPAALEGNQAYCIRQAQQPLIKDCRRSTRYHRRSWPEIILQQ